MERENKQIFLNLQMKNHLTLGLKLNKSNKNYNQPFTSSMS